jgi:hypothetical protein
VDWKDFITLVNDDLVKNMARNHGISDTAPWSYHDDAGAKVKFEVSPPMSYYSIPNHLF